MTDNVIDRSEKDPHEHDAAHAGEMTVCDDAGHDHEHHDHHLHHVHETRVEGAKYLIIAMVITGSIVVAELVGGVLSNSLALLSDAGHVLTDFLALLLSYVAFKFANRAATDKMSWGFYRMEILAALVNSVVLGVVTTLIFIEAYDRLLHPHPVDGTLMLVVAAIGLVANLASAKVLQGHAHDNLNIKSAFLHVIADALSSVGVIVGGLIIMFTGYYIVDPVISIILALVIVRGAYNLGKEAVAVLMEAVPNELETQSVTTDLLKVDGVKDVHHLHIWTISSGIHALSTHVLIDDVLTSESTRILDDIEDMLKEKHNITHVTIQFECENCSNGQVCYLSTPTVRAGHHH